MGKCKEKFKVDTTVMLTWSICQSLHSVCEYYNTAFLHHTSVCTWGRKE